MVSPLAVLRDRLAALPAPLIIYNKSHSGSRLLARVLRTQGVFLGAECNDSEDALPIFPLVELLVVRYYPNYHLLWPASAAAQAEVADTAAQAFARHLVGYNQQQHQAWGWKLCETLYAMPVLHFLFPQAKVVHLVRDGRDVAWSNHVAPELPFWRKVYFNTDKIERHRGLWLTNRAYERRPYLYNALHWVNSVETGRAYGAMLHDRYLEVRYEDLCHDFHKTLTRLLDTLGLKADRSAITQLASEVRLDSVGKFHHYPHRLQRRVLRIIEPTLRSFGYPLEPSPWSRGPFGRILARLSGA